MRSFFYTFIALLFTITSLAKSVSSTSTEICSCRDRKYGNSSAALRLSKDCCESANGVWNKTYCTITKDSGSTEMFGACCIKRMHLHHKCFAKNDE